MDDPRRRRFGLEELYDLVPEDDDGTQEVAAAEVAAVHAVPDTPRRAFRDPARRDADIGYDADEDPPHSSWFDDEEPELPETPPSRREAETADVDDVLIIQHYAFDESPDDLTED